MFLTLVQPAATAPVTPERFGELFEQHADSVYNFCFRRLADWAMAEDMTSAVFLEAWRRRDRVDLTEQPPLPWLLGVANNLMRNHRRSLRRARAALERFHASASTPDFGDELTDRLDAERRMRAVQERIGALAPHERETLELCVWAELSYADAALALEVPVGTVRSRLSRALLLLPIGATLAGGALAATQIWQSSHPADIVRVECYERASLEAPHREASSDVLGLRGPRQRARGATAMCAGFWTRGVLGHGGKAPRLEACVHRGRTAVFPGPPSTCVALAMRPVTGFTREQARIVAYLDRIAALLSRCGDPDEIARRLGAIVRSRGGDLPELNLPLAPGRRLRPGAVAPRRAEGRAGRVSA